MKKPNVKRGQKRESTKDNDNNLIYSKKKKKMPLSHFIEKDATSHVYCMLLLYVHQPW